MLCKEAHVSEDKIILDKFLAEHIKFNSIDIRCAGRRVRVDGVVVVVVVVVVVGVVLLLAGGINLQKQAFHETENEEVLDLSPYYM